MFVQSTCRFVALALISILSISRWSASSAFAPSINPIVKGKHAVLQVSRRDNDDEVVVDGSRRRFGEKIMYATIAAATTTSITQQQPAYAKDAVAEEKEKILAGYKRLNYLLDNWDKETSFCGNKIDPFTGKQVCERTPTKVMEYMGYKSTNDPLFKAEKTLRKLESLAPSTRETDYLDAVERWQSAADEASAMAYTSSWAGPQNPNGGDESIEYFLDRAKQQVITARDILKDVIDILDLKA